MSGGLWLGVGVNGRDLELAYGECLVTFGKRCTD